MWDTIHAASQLVKRDNVIDFTVLEESPSGARIVASILLVFVAIISVVLIALLHYTFKLLLTLTVVEEPQAVYLPVNEDTEARSEGDKVFITSSIRGTLRHLRSEAGIWSPWRGLGPHIVFGLANGFAQVAILKILKPFMPLWLATIIGGIASMVALSKLELVCTHIMISAPEPTRWWARYRKTSWAQAKKTIPAIIIWAATLQLVAQLIEVAKKDISSGLRIAIFSTSILVYILIAIPATILLVRVQASVLSDDIGTIVPFDKTFGQDTSDTDGVLTVKKAIKSINCKVFKRVCIFLAKSVPLLMASSFIIVALCVQIYLSI